MSAAKNELIAEILTRLTANIREQIFLCNLESTISAGLVDAGSALIALSDINPVDIEHMHENDFLGHIDIRLKDPKYSLALQTGRKRRDSPLTPINGDFGPGTGRSDAIFPS